MSKYKIHPGKEIFPIKSSTGCMLKWSWSTIRLFEGTTSSCHRCAEFPIDPDNFQNFHNVPQKIVAREKMIAGQWPGQGCEYCKNIEQAGGQSDRLMQLNRLHGIDKVPPELLKDPLATQVTPTILEIWFNNTCNMTCLYCSPNYSSKWTNEIKNFGPINLGSSIVRNNVIKNPHYDRMVNDLWTYLETAGSAIRHFHILGGEPLLQKEFDQCIDFWQDHPSTGLTINVISNLMIPHAVFVEKLQRFQQLYENNAILTLKLTASLDGWGPEEQHTRFGLDLAVWEKNFEYLLDKTWCSLGINSCLSSLSLQNMPALVDKINQWNLKAVNRIDWSFQLPIGLDDTGFHPNSFGSDAFVEDFKNTLALMPDLTQAEQQSKQHMIGLMRTQEQSVLNLHHVKNLIDYLTEIDRRRGTNWQQIYSWLQKYLDD